MNDAEGIAIVRKHCIACHERTDEVALAAENIASRAHGAIEHPRRFVYQQTVQDRAMLLGTAAAINRRRKAAALGRWMRRCHERDQSGRREARGRAATFGLGVPPLLAGQAHGAGLALWRRSRHSGFQRRRGYFPVNHGVATPVQLALLMLMAAADRRRRRRLPRADPAAAAPTWLMGIVRHHRLYRCRQRP